MNAMPTNIAQVSIVTFALLCASLPLAGCSQQSSSTPFLTPSGVRVQTPPASANAPGQPPGVQGVVGNYDGVYQGTSNVVFTGAGRCVGTQTVTDFHVRANVAEWAGYSGTIDAGGRVQMHRGIGWLVGRFQGNTFAGRLEVGAFSDRPSCVYDITLQRVGP
jgi:hypothetical protein